MMKWVKTAEVVLHVVGAVLCDLSTVVSNARRRYEQATHVVFQDAAPVVVFRTVSN